jgi:hypothetical protein
MAAETEFAIGAKASCTDGPCGEVTRLIVDPAARTVTHLVIKPEHEAGRARLVPLDLVGATAGEIRLRCTLAEFGQLERADETDLVEGRASRLGPAGERAPMGIPKATRTVVEEIVPLGEIQVRPGEPVHALDGEIGHVQGCLVDADRRLTHVLLKEGHFWGRKEVAIPVSAVTGLEDGIRLNLTRKQVEDLPPAG